MVVQHPKYEDRLMFENLTVAPYARELIDTSLLTKDYFDFLNNFHETCLQKLTPFLQEDARALAYVQRACAPLIR